MSRASTWTALVPIKALVMTKSTGNAIELMRIGLYVFFPITVFYFFNHPDFFEKYVTDKRKELDIESVRPPLTLEENKKMRLRLKEEKQLRRKAAANEGN